MLTLQLFPVEFRALVDFLRSTTADQDQVPLTARYLTTMVLQHYLETIKPNRILAWQLRRIDREYKLTLPLPVAKALHQEMQVSMLMGHQQLLLVKLDGAIVNYRNPHSEPQLISTFFKQA